jgi:hypothetical protein
MTKGEAKRLETETVVFPIDFGQENQTGGKAENIPVEIVEKQSIRTDIQIRFARLKKSLRKRSASIL